MAWAAYQTYDGVTLQNISMVRGSATYFSSFAIATHAVAAPAYDAAILMVSWGKRLATTTSTKVCLSSCIMVR